MINRYLLPQHFVPTVVVIDSAEPGHESLCQIVEGFGYRVYAAGNAEDGEALVADVRPDLVITELMLEDINGLVLCSNLAHAQIPVVVCTRTRRKWDGILALRLGAEDFILMPADKHEISARVEAVLRRRMVRTKESAEGGADVIQLDSLSIDKVRREVMLGSEPIHLTPTEFRLLLAFAGQPDVPLGRDLLAQEIWGFADADIGRTIDVHIRRLRAKLQSRRISAPFIVSVRGIGYKLVVGSRLMPLEARAS